MVTTPEKDFQKDLKALTDKLTKKKLVYRVFNSSLRIRESKWTDKEQASTKP